MSEKEEKAIDISKYKPIQTIKDLKCPRCREKQMRIVGVFNKLDKSHELECLKCFYTERVDPKNVEFTYEPPKEPKKKKGEAGN